MDAAGYHRKTVDFEVQDHEPNFPKLTSLKIFLVNSQKPLSTAPVEVSTTNEYMDLSYPPTDGYADFEIDEYSFDREDHNVNVEPLRLEQTGGPLDPEEVKSFSCMTMSCKFNIILLFAALAVYR